MNILGTIFTEQFSLGQFIIAIVTSLILGFLTGLFYMFRNRHTKSFALALVLIPALEALVIMLVNDNLGMGLSVAGSFALIRFRSIKGDARDLTCIFLAMVIGILCGTGYVVLAAVFVAIILLVAFLLTAFNFGFDSTHKNLLITCPEDVDIKDIEKVISAFTSDFSLQEVKTAVMGTLIKLEYRIELKDKNKIMPLMNELRKKNSNLEISISAESCAKEEL